MILADDNATKYGALSVADGRVEVDWAPNADRGGIVITWRERDGPPVTPPSRRGFGSRLLEQGLPRELGGKVELEFPPEGVRCAIRLRVSAKVRLS